MSKELKTLLEEFYLSQGKLTVLTGAGISVESNLPTYRGPQGLWTRQKNAKNSATYSQFLKNPYETWSWALGFAAKAWQAVPNRGHSSLVLMEKLLQGRFSLITQNVDGLHRKSGTSESRLLEVHGNIQKMRCSKNCTPELYPVPEKLLQQAMEVAPSYSKEDFDLLSCPKCASLTRPHVLFFQEYYNETFFSYNSCLKIAEETDLLILVGTAGKVDLPHRIASIVHKHKGAIININPDENAFAPLIRTTEKGFYLKETSTKGLIQILLVLNDFAHTLQGQNRS